MDSTPHGKKRAGESTSTPDEQFKTAKQFNGISPNSLQSPDAKPTVKSFGDRPNKGEIVVELKSTISTSACTQAALLVGGQRKVKIGHYAIGIDQEPAVGIQQPFRYMFTTTEQRSAALERSFGWMEKQLLNHAGLPPEVLTMRAPVGVPSQDTVVCFGRVCTDVSEGKLSMTSVMLEGGRMEGGQRVKLVLNELPSFALFPGQFIVVEGINSSGNRMVVRKLCEGVPRPLPRSSPTELSRFHHDSSGQSGAPLKIMIAAGPFSCCDNLEYEPLRDLLHQAAKIDPCDVLVLAGPFIDASNPKVAAGQAEMIGEAGSAVTVDLWTLFCFKVSGLLEAIFESDPDLQLQVVLLPALSDAHHEFVYPQPPFADRAPGGITSPLFPEEKMFRLDVPFSQGPKRAIHLVGNPSMLRLNEVVIGATSTDVLMQLGKDEVSQSPPTSNRLERLAEHMISQQSFNPGFPSAGPDASPIDLRFSEKWRMPVSPDILLVPSRLATFGRKLSNGTLAINPGQLAKGSGGGTFAKLTIFPLSEDHLAKITTDSNGNILHQVSERTSLQIKRI